MSINGKLISYKGDSFLVICVKYFNYDPENGEYLEFVDEWHFINPDVDDYKELIKQCSKPTGVGVEISEVRNATITIEDGQLVDSDFDGGNGEFYYFGDDGQELPEQQTEDWY